MIRCDETINNILNNEIRLILGVDNNKNKESNQEAINNSEDNNNDYYNYDYVPGVWFL